MSKETKLYTSIGTIVIRTHQYTIGTYIVVRKGNDIVSQSGSTKDEDDVHIEFRKKALKKGDTILGGDFIPYEGKEPINCFLQPVEKK